MKIVQVKKSVAAPLTIGLFFIEITNRNWDGDVAEYLELTLEKYQGILINCGAKLFINNNNPYNCTDCYFEHLSDAEKCLETLEPFYVMVKIME